MTRKEELLRASLEYIAANGLSDMSLRPLAKAIGSSPRVLLYLFGSKDRLIRDVLALNRAQQQELLDRARQRDAGARESLQQLWEWIVDPARDNLRRLFFEAYIRSAAATHHGSADASATHQTRAGAPATRHDGADASATQQAGADAGADEAWQDFARRSVDDWLDSLDALGLAGRAEQTLALAVIRGLVLDLLATNDLRRVNAAWRRFLDAHYPVS